MNKSKIEWCDRTWNPITGCLHGCPYCYAKGITRRFCTNEHGKDGLLSPCSGDCKACSDMDGMEFIEDKFRVSHGNEAFPFGFYPTIHLNRMSRPAGVKIPQNVFVCSMSDLFGEWVPDKYIQKVFDACAAAPWHQYLFLTKNPERYAQINSDEKEPAPLEIYNTPVYFGTSVTNQKQFDNAYKSAADWISIEPLCEELTTDDNFVSFYHNSISEIETARWDWVVIGAETGNRKEKVKPERSWIESIVDECRYWETPVFMKNSLADIWEEPLIQEYPWRKEK